MSIKTMEPINLDNFGGTLENGREVQRLLTLLNNLEIAGITDIPTARAAIQRYLDGAFLNEKRQMSPAEKQQARETKVRRVRNNRINKLRPDRSSEVCPSCGSHLWTMVWANDDELWIEVCKSCRFSKIADELYPYEGKM